MPASRIAGTGRYLPAQVLTNEALAQRVEGLKTRAESGDEDAIRADTDILYITRTYTFTRADEVVTTQ